jgi:hypothetical protein
MTVVGYVMKMLIAASPVLQQIFVSQSGIAILFFSSGTCKYNDYLFVIDVESR